MDYRSLFSKFRKFVLGTDWIKTIRINFHYFSFGQAIRFPILVSHRVVFKKLGGKVKLESIIKTGMFKFGYLGLGTQDFFYERTIWDVCGLVRICGNNVGIGRGSKFCVYGNISLGDSFIISGRSTIICNKQILFGDGVLISWDVLVMDTDYHTIVDNEGKTINKDRPIIVGNDVWIGCRSTVLKGSNIPQKSIIAAGSLISGKMEEDSCIYTSDKKILKKQIAWYR